MDINKNNAEYTKLDNITDDVIVQIYDNSILSNATANKIKHGNAEPVILATQIDWTGLTTTVNDLPIEINTSQDVVGYLAGALDFIYNGLHQELGDYSTKLNITYNMLESYASYFDDFSKITQTYDMIQTYVVNENNFSRFTQTAEMFETYVSSYTGDFSYIKQTADYIQTYVASYTGDFSKITQTADYIQTYVASYTGDFSKITQTADRIESIVQTYSGAWSGIEQTAEQIKASVVNDINESYMLLTADQFNTHIEDKVTGYFADLHMDPNAINATVSGYAGSYGRWNLTADMFETYVSSYTGDFSYIRQTADKIESIVSSYGESWSKIEQFDDNITATVKQEVTGYMASLGIDVDAIRAAVTHNELEGALEVSYNHIASYIRNTEENLGSRIDQTESMISTYVYNENGNSTLQQLADEINATVEDIEGNKARWTLTADMYETYVSSYTDDFSYIRQTADKIESIVSSYGESWSKIEQFDDSITATVQSEVNAYMSRLDLSAEHIKGEVISDIAESYMLLTSDTFETNVRDKVTGYFADLHMDPNAINATVQGYNESYAKWNIAYDQISSKVWNNDFDSLIEQKADSITSTVTQHLENSDYFDSFVNHQDLVAYATKNDLSSYATVSSLNEYATNSRVDQLSDEISLSVTKQQFTDALASYTTYGYVSSRIIELNNTLSGEIESLGGELTAYVDERFNNLPLGDYITYSAHIVDSYAAVDINGYLNTFVDLFVWQDETSNNGEEVIYNQLAVQDAIVWAYLPDGLVTSGSSFMVNRVSNTNEYKDVRQFTNIADRTKAKGNLRLDIQIPNQ